MTTAHYRTSSLTVAFQVIERARFRVTLDGDVDAFSIVQVSRRISDVVNRSSPASIELDLGAVEFLDIAAATELRRLRRSAAVAGCDLSVIAATSVTWWLLAFVGFGFGDVYPPALSRRPGTDPGS